MNIPLQPTWADIAVRLALTMLAGAVIGFNRGARGHAAGVRTTILVGLAASVAMIQANILLSASGKTPQSFAVMDLMRLPLGILTGVEFIGGGAILRKLLGTATTALAVLTLRTLKWVDGVIPREHRARVVVRCERIGTPSSTPRRHKAAEALGSLSRTEAVLGLQSGGLHIRLVLAAFRRRISSPRFAARAGQELPSSHF